MLVTLPIQRATAFPGRMVAWIAIVLAIAVGWGRTGSSVAEDWPTYQHDDQRSSVTSEELKLPLAAAWVWSSPQPPQMAWDAPARRDPYNKVEGLKHRAEFDRVFHPIIVADSVYFGSSASDQIICLDLVTGQERWSYFTEGPVRLAPTVSEGSLYCGSDDGYLYALDTRTGELKWKQRIGPRDERLPGNNRLISRWPIRTGVVARDNIVYVAAGMFPNEGVYVVAFAADTGKELWRTPIPQLPAQGYLLASATRLYVPSGRNNPIVFDRANGSLLRVVEGAGGTYCLLTGDTLLFGPGKTGQLGVVPAEQRDQLATFHGNHMIVTPDVSYLHTDSTLSSLDRNRYLDLATQQAAVATQRRTLEEKISEQPSTEQLRRRAKILQLNAEHAQLAEQMKACQGWLAPCPAPLSLVLAARSLFAGGNNVVVAHNAEDGHIAWQEQLDGNAYGMAVGQQHLIVSTDAGKIYAFRPSVSGGTPPHPTLAEQQTSSPGVVEAAPNSSDTIHWRADASRIQPSSSDDTQRLPTVDGKVHWHLAGHPQWVGKDPLQAICLDGTTTSMLASAKDAKQYLPKREFTVEATVLIERANEWGAMAGYLQDNGEMEQGWLLGNHGHLFTFALSTRGANSKDNARDGIMTYISDQKSFASNTWYHVVGTYDGNIMRLYVDGELRAESSAQSDDIFYPDDAVLALGGYVDRDEHYRLNGMLHEVVITPRALSPEEVIERAAVKKNDAKNLPTATPARARPSVGPIVRMTAETEATIAWQDSPLNDTKHTDREVKYGLAGQARKQAAISASRDWQNSQLAGLARGVEYEFEIEPTPTDDTPMAGKIYRFNTSHGYLRPSFPKRPSPYEPHEEIEQRVIQILELGGWQSGYAIVLGETDGQLAYELSKRSRLHVTVIEPDAMRADAIRRRLVAAGVYGTHVVVQTGDMTNLAQTDYCANVVVARSALDGAKFTGNLEEARRIVRPAGGVAFLEPDDFESPWVRPELPGAGRWTHQYGEADNTSCSKDNLVVGNVAVQWWGPPGPHPMPDRGGRNPSPLAVQGYLFTQGDRILFGQDAYNGTIYWTMMLPELRRSNIPRDCSNMVAAGDTLYVAMTGTCLCIDPRSGVVRQVYRVVPPATSESKYDWGYIGYVDETLIGTAVVRGGAYIADAGEWYEDYEPNQIAKVVSPGVFAMNRHTGELDWQYERGAIVHSTITMDEASVYFVESRNATVVKSVAPRQPHSDLQRDQFLVALDRRSGTVRWEKEVDLTRCDFMTYMAYSDHKLVVAGTDKDRTFHHFAFDTTDGRPLWDRHDSTAKTHHSGHLDHLVIIGDKIYSNLHVMDLQTGRDVAPQFAERRGCGIMAGSNHMLFFRDHFHGMWDLESQKRWEFTGIRPGCWLGMVPAAGVVVAPESSSGCSCTHAIQTSVGFRPTP